MDAQAQYDSHKSLGISKPIRGTKSNFKKRSIGKYANRYKVSTIGIENLTMGSKDNKKGRNFNKLVNNEWNRNSFEWLITKLCDTNNIVLCNVNCAY